MSDELERLAERGRRIAKKEREQQARSAEQSAGAAGSEIARRVRASVSSYARWGFWVLGVLLAFPVFVLLPPFLPPSWTIPDASDGDPATLATLLAACVPGLALFALRPWIGDRAVARERAWARALPFALDGYPDALGSSTTEGTFTLRLVFADEDFAQDGERSPDRELLADAFRAVGGRLDVEQNGALRMQTSFDFGESSVLTNAHVRAWVRRAIPCLLAIHARHPLERVEVVGFR